MATKKIFTVNAYGRNIEIVCETYRRGYTNYERATCDDLGVKGIYSYQNRPWQSCTFDCALSELAGKASKKDATIGAEIKRLHDTIVNEDIKKAEEMFSRFEKAYNASSQRTRDALKETVIGTPEQAENIIGAIEGISSIERLLGA